VLQTDFDFVPLFGDWELLLCGTQHERRNSES
jgi:hypothetical protein